jgi:hypothetical protein
MRNNYDDLMGLDMYDEGMGEFYSAEMLKDQLIAAGSSAAAILLAAWAMPKLPAPKDWTPTNQHNMRAALATVAGMLAARGLWGYNRDAAMAVLGGVSGLGIAQLVNGYLFTDKDGNPTKDKDGKLVMPLGTPLGDDGYSYGALSAGDEALLTAYSPDTRTLSLTEVASNRGAFQGTGVNVEQLMGTVVATETLGEGGYNAYLA